MAFKRIMSAEKRKAPNTAAWKDGVLNVVCLNCEHETDYDGDLELLNYCQECGLPYDKEDDIWIG